MKVETEHRSKRKIMEALLTRLGNDQMTLQEFLQRLKQHDMTTDDIDRYLDGDL